MDGFPARDMIRTELEKRLNSMKEKGEKPDTITFAGNGEPTIHPFFAGIIDDTLLLRDRFFPEAQIAVLSNCTMLDDPLVFNALELVDLNILKIDSAIEDTMRLLNQPEEGFSYSRMVANILRFKERFVLQTLFIRGTYKGKEVDNTSDKELYAWLGLVKKLTPRMVMIYTIARDTPSSVLFKIPREDLLTIAEKVEETGIAVQVSD